VPAPLAAVAAVPVADPRAQELERLWGIYRAEPCDRHRNTLVEAYHELAREVTRRFASRLPRSVDRGDLDTAASFGLMSAVSAFDPARGVPFESYCEVRIKGALLDELRSQDWLPRHWRHRFEVHKRALEKLRGDFEREPQDHEVARELGLSLEVYVQTFGVSLPSGATGGMPADDSGPDSVLSLEIVPDTHCEAPGEGISRNELFSLIAQRLNDQEYRILYLRYWEGLAMREIGETLDVSESRVCKIHARLIERLKEHFRVHLAD
jgi:RNA polymerase sigma factor for flagellar operon FliA